MTDSSGICNSKTVDVAWNQWSKPAITLKGTREKNIDRGRCARYIGKRDRSTFLIRSRYSRKRESGEKGISVR